VLQAVREDEAARSAERLLAVRPRSKGELLDRLKRRGVSEALARDTVERFEKAGIVNDEAFARLMARATLSARPAGPRLLTAKLRGLRVDATLAQTAATEAVQGRDLLGDATTLARKKLRLMPAKLDDAARQRRLLGALARRGYDAGVVYAAVRAAMGARMAQPPAADE
jgi:regulatory protein